MTGPEAWEDGAAAGGISGKPGSYAYREGQKRLYLIWWVVGTLVEIAAVAPWVWRQVNWRALAMTSGLFLALIFGVENLALYWGWWVWNESELWGPKVLLVPLEEFMLYFLVVPSVVSLLLLIRKMALKALHEG